MSRFAPSRGKIVILICIGYLLQLACALFCFMTPLDERVFAGTGARAKLRVGRNPIFHVIPLWGLGIMGWPGNRNIELEYGKASYWLDYDRLDDIRFDSLQIEDYGDHIRVFDSQSNETLARIDLINRRYLE